MRGPCTLVFGVSGVGKTSACEAFCARHTNTLFVSASSLLESVKRMSAEALRTAAAQDIIDNQEVLGRALAAFRQGRETRPVLIDAHGVIDNDHELVRVPVSAIRALDPDRLVLIEAPPRVIAQRRAGATRPRPLRNEDALVREMTAEREVVMAFADELGLDLRIGDLSDDVTLDQLLSS